MPCSDSISTDCSSPAAVTGGEEGSLQFTVERSSKTLLGSVVNKEGLVNVYRGTGRILMAPTIPETTMQGGSAEEAATGAEKKPDGATSRILSAFKL